MSKSGASKGKPRPSVVAKKALTPKQIQAIVVKLRRAAAGAIGGAPHVGAKPPAAHAVHK
jgi:hypothetical protein